MARAEASMMACARPPSDVLYCGWWLKTLARVEPVVFLS